MPACGLIGYLTDDDKLASKCSQRNLKEADSSSSCSGSSSDSSLAEMDVKAEHAVVVDAYHDRGKFRQVAAKADAWRFALDLST